MIDFSLVTILPAVTLNSAASAVPVARALLEGGVKVMEVAFRTPEAAACIRAIREEVPAITVGAGTLLSIGQLREARNAGAQFGLSPGFNPRIASEALAMDFPFIPGAMTPGEIEQSIEMGFRLLKLFPAAQIGGVGMLKALRGPYGPTGVKFIPMGGVNARNMNEFLSLDNVACVGGSWLATPEMIREKQFSEITRNAREAMILRG